MIFKLKISKVGDDYKITFLNIDKGIVNNKDFDYYGDLPVLSRGYCCFYKKNTGDIYSLYLPGCRDFQSQPYEIVRKAEFKRVYEALMCFKENAKQVIKGVEE